MSEENLSVVLGQESRELKLADGRKFKLSPLTMRDVAKLHEKCGIDSLSNQEEIVKAFSKIENLIYALFLSLHRAEKNLTYDEVGDMFLPSDMKTFQDTVDLILTMSGLKQKNESGATVKNEAVNSEAPSAP